MALLIGIGWLARDIAIGLPAGLFARTAYLLRYEDFFALEPPLLGTVAADLPAFFGAKAAALATNLLTLTVSFGLVLLPPMVLAIRARGDRAEVRATTRITMSVACAPRARMAVNASWPGVSRKDTMPRGVSTW